MAVTLDLAISAIKAGRKQEGRQLLNLLIQQNPNDEKAWLWMSSVVDTDEQRARCLYHVMAINPNSDLARRGLEVLGIVVSDSRPVKIPRDSQPIHIPNPTAAPQPVPAQPAAASRPVPQPQRPQSQPQPEMQGAAATDDRRPFLIDPKTITQELPFVPVTSPYPEQEQQPLQAQPVEEPVKVSPGILAINLDEVEEDDQPATEPADTPAPKSELTATQKMPEPSLAAAAGTAAAMSVHSTKTQQMELPQEAAEIAQQLEAVAEEANTQNPSDSSDDSQELMLVLEESVDTPSKPVSPVDTPQSPSEPVPVVAPNPANGTPDQQQDPNQLGNNGQFYPPMPGVPAHTTTGPVSTDTRPSQPVPVTYPNPGAVPYNQNPLYPSPHADPTLGMPNQQYAAPAPVPSIHTDPTMGMPLPPPQNVTRAPSEPMPVIHSAATMGMVPYGQQYPQPQLPSPSIHSSATMMMPTMSEEEARARLESKPFVPTATATAMPLQSSAWGAAPTMGYGFDTGFDYDEEDDGEDEVNILAVIIFGTLSLTALGGIGMLLLLIFTTPSSLG